MQRIIRYPLTPRGHSAVWSVAIEVMRGVPKSKSRSKRSRYVPPRPPTPKASPRWVPWLGLGLIVLGILTILLNYNLPFLLPIGDWTLLIGFVLMGGGLGVLSQWR